MPSLLCSASLPLTQLPLVVHMSSYTHMSCYRQAGTTSAASTGWENATGNKISLPSLLHHLAPVLEPQHREAPSASGDAMPRCIPGLRLWASLGPSLWYQTKGLWVRQQFWGENKQLIFWLLLRFSTKFNTLQVVLKTQALRASRTYCSGLFYYTILQPFEIDCIPWQFPERFFFSLYSWEGKERACKKWEIPNFT